MNRHQRWAKRASDQRKRQEILRWLASFAVTAVVVVVAFVLPSPPVAEFIRLETFGNAIYFETSVRDADQAILEGTLKIRLEAPLYSEERSLSPGLDSGIVVRIIARTEEMKKCQVLRDLNREVILFCDRHGFMVSFNQLVVRVENQEPHKPE